MGRLIVIIGIFIAVAAAVGSTLPQEPRKFRIVGYFKSDNSNRIHTIAFTPEATEVEIREYARQMTHTEGQLTASYFYPEGSVIPADGVTLARDVLSVNEVLYDLPGLSAWTYAYMRAFDGTELFVNCLTQPQHDLCRAPPNA